MCSFVVRKKTSQNSVEADPEALLSTCHPPRPNLSFQGLDWVISEAWGSCWNSLSALSRPVLTGVSVLGYNANCLIPWPSETLLSEPQSYFCNSHDHSDISGSMCLVVLMPAHCLGYKYSVSLVSVFLTTIQCHWVTRMAV